MRSWRKQLAVSSPSSWWQWAQPNPQEHPTNLPAAPQADPARKNTLGLPGQQGGRTERYQVQKGTELTWRSQSQPSKPLALSLRPCAPCLPWSLSLLSPGLHLCFDYHHRETQHRPDLFRGGASGPFPQLRLSVVVSSLSGGGGGRGPQSRPSAIAASLAPSQKLALPGLDDCIPPKDSTGFLCGL